MAPANLGEVTALLLDVVLRIYVHSMLRMDHAAMAPMAEVSDHSGQLIFRQERRLSLRYRKRPESTFVAAKSANMRLLCPVAVNVG